MTVLCHTYDSREAAKADYARFGKWSREREADVSFWRGCSKIDGNHWLVALEPGDGPNVREFDWRGERVGLSQLQMFEFVLRRAQRHLRLRAMAAAKSAG